MEKQGYIGTALGLVLSGATLVTQVGCSLATDPVRNRYEGGPLKPHILAPYNEKMELPALTGKAMAMWARDYERFATQDANGNVRDESHRLYTLSRDGPTIRPNTPFSLQVLNKSEYNQPSIRGMFLVDLLGIGNINTVGRPFLRVQEEVQRKYANLLGISPSQIAFNYANPIEGESIVSDTYTLFTQEGGKILPVTRPSTLDQVLSAAGLPGPRHEWNQVVITRRVRDSEFRPTSVEATTEKGNRTIEELVLIANLQPAIDGTGNSADMIDVYHGDRIYLPTENRAWIQVLTDYLTALNNVASAAASIGNNAKAIDGAVRYFEESPGSRDGFTSPSGLDKAGKQIGLINNGVTAIKNIQGLAK